MSNYLEKDSMNNNKQVAELLAKLATLVTDDGGNIAEVKLRRDYWRQMTGEARAFVREADVEIDKALVVLNSFSKRVKAARKHYIGPKVPPKTVQKPHRSN